MGSLKEQLLKAKLITAKQAKKVDRDNREKRRVSGIDQLKLEEKQRQIEYQLKLAEKAEQDRKLEQERLRSEDSQTKDDNLKDLLHASSVNFRTNGRFKFYYVDRKGYIPYIMVSQEVKAGLENGDVAIVEDPWDQGNSVVMVKGEIAKRLLEEKREYVLFFNYLMQ